MKPKRVKQAQTPSAERRIENLALPIPARVIKHHGKVVLAKLPKTTRQTRMSEKFVWDDSCADKAGQWSWGEFRDWGSHAWEAKLLPLLIECSTKSWSEIEAEGAGNAKRHKAYPLNAICKEAFRRLREIELDDLEELYRLRLTGAGRFYGFRIHSLWMALWWDGKHMICPSQKR